MTPRHRIAALLLLTLILAITAWRLRPRVPPDLAPPCPRLAVVEVGGRPLAVCLKGKVTPAGEVLAAAGIHGCAAARGEVRQGDALRVSGECQVRRIRLAAPTRLCLGMPLDLNRATARELDALPRVGPSLARRIVADRAARGPFSSVADLVRVKGVGPSTVRRLGDLVSASGGGDAGR